MSARARFDSFEHLIDSKGKVWRFTDDDPSWWKLNYFETKLASAEDEERLKGASE